MKKRGKCIWFMQSSSIWWWSESITRFTRFFHLLSLSLFLFSLFVFRFPLTFLPACMHPAARNLLRNTACPVSLSVPVPVPVCVYDSRWNFTATWNTFSFFSLLLHIQPLGIERGKGSHCLVEWILLEKGDCTLQLQLKLKLHAGWGRGRGREGKKEREREKQEKGGAEKDEQAAKQRKAKLARV